MTTQQENPSKKKHLMDVIDYQKDIAPYRFIEIYSGVGSGKNHLIESFAQGIVPKAPKMRVLLVTSRKAKVDETFKKYEHQDKESLDLFKDRIGKAWETVDQNGDHTLWTLGNTICSTAFLAGYLKNVYRSDDRRTHLWDMYDMIVIDEVHSMLLDASYQSAPFHIFDLINHYLERCVSNKYPDPICKHLIIMTGTNEPLRGYSPVNGVNSNLLYLIDKCINIQPENVGFVEMKHTVCLIKRVIQDGKRCIYFANSISRIFDLYFDEELQQDRYKMVVSFSDEEKREALKNKDEQAWSDMNDAEKEISKEYKIPERFSVFITTSRYREGVNIEDPIDVMIAEAHSKAEVIQMAGRVRAKDNEEDLRVKDLYLVTDAQPHRIDYVEEELNQKISYLQLDWRKRVDKMSPINALINQITDEKLPYFIDLVESKFPYIRYSYLYKCFLKYETKVSGRDYTKGQNQLWEVARSNNTLPERVKEWFPEAEVHSFVSSDEQKRAESLRILEEFDIELGEEHHYTKEKHDQLEQKLSEIWGFKRLNKCLKQFSNIICKRTTGHLHDKYYFIQE